MFDNPIIPGSYVRKAIKQKAVAEVPKHIKERLQQGVVTLWPGMSKDAIEAQVEVVVEARHGKREHEE